MPTKRENLWKYAKETGWPEACRQVADRAGGVCEFCGIAKGSPTRSGGPVVLTVAHLDHDPPNHDVGRLRHLCQACHISYDAKHRAAERCAAKAAGDLFGGAAVAQAVQDADRRPSAIIGPGPAIGA